MDLNTRRLEAAREIYETINVVGPHFRHEVMFEKEWKTDGNVVERMVKFEEDVALGQYESFDGSFSVTFMGGSSIPSSTFVRVGKNDTHEVKGEELQTFLRQRLPHLASPFTADVHVNLTRNYADDIAALSAQGVSPVTARNLARHMLAPLERGFGTISAVSFLRNVGAGTYQIEISIPVAGIPHDQGDLEQFSEDALAQTIEVVDAIQDRLREVTSSGTKFDESAIVIRTATHAYRWGQVLDAHKTFEIRRGLNLTALDAEQVMAATELQIGDLAVVADVSADCYAVARIDEDGLCHPIKGDLSFADAETMLNTHASKAAPIYRSFSS